ncbi:MAG: hypothetical protein ABJC39_02080 [Chloroflexota bacterium]
MQERRIARVVAVCAWLAAIVPVVALVAFLAAYRFDATRLTDLPSIVGDRPSGPTLRIAGLLDMTAYLPVAPVVIYLDRRLRHRAPDLVGLLTFGGLAYVLLGSLGGTLFATVGPPLVEDGSETARVVFAALGSMVTVGLWGTLELIGFGVWLLGVGWLLRAERLAYGNLGVLAGIGSLLSAARTGLTGRSVGDLPGPVDFLVVGLLGVALPWLAWTGLRLYRGQIPARGES